MSDQNSAYSARYYGDPSAENPFGIEAYGLRSDPALHAHMKRGGCVVAFITARKDIQSAMASASFNPNRSRTVMPTSNGGSEARSPLQDMEAAISEPGALK